jgi:tryptophanyl-tRNA synthetase
MTLFSGIQPSGNLHLGNYLGAIRNWVALQNKYQSIFCVVDLHAITVPQKPEVLRKKILAMAKIYLAAGIDPEKSTLFIQSDISAHSELMWALNTLTKTGELYKMTQFKDKTGTDKKEASVSAGLLNYPILMAADILLYNADLVPVGDDQLQHIELTRTLARRFNENFGEVFKVPKAYIKKETARIMGLDDPTKKMSKSALSKYNRIELLDSPEEIKEKIMKAVTDNSKEIKYSDEQPAIKNLLNIFSAVTEEEPKKIAEQYQTQGYQKFKEVLAEAVIKFLAPFQEKFNQLSDEEVEKVLQQGKRKLLPLAEEKMKRVKEKMGLGI